MGGKGFPNWVVVKKLTVIQLGVQIMDEGDQLTFGFDLLDPTKIVPVELVPITPLGKLQLNRNPLNYFAETEQVMVSSITRWKTSEIQ